MQAVTLRTEVWTLENQYAQRVRRLLCSHFGCEGLRADWDDRTNQVVATGPPRVLERARNVVKNVDIIVYACYRPVHAYTLRHRLAPEVLPVLRDIAAYLSQVRARDPYAPPRPALVLHADRARNQILAYGPAGDFCAIKRMLDLVDVEH